MKILLSIVLLCQSLIVFSQNTSQYDNIRLTNANEYRKAEPQVILAADYVYSTPVDKDNLNRKNAVTFIMKWMGGNPDYSFVPDKTAAKIMNNDMELLGVYYTCLAKYALEKGKTVNREELKYNAYLLVAVYCENPANNYIPKGETKKLIEAKNQNKLKDYLEAKSK